MASNTPRKVNAAQLANRKIKAPTRRAKPSSNDGNDIPRFAPMPASVFGAPAGGNAFAGGPSSANNSFNFAAPLQANFGGSMSFPPSTNTPSTLGNGTSESAGGGFFGQSNASNSTNFFGSAPQPGGGGFSFGAAPTQNQSATNSFSFGQNAKVQPANGGFNFGQSTTAPVNNPFQTSQASSSTPGLSFGTTAPTTNTGSGFNFAASQPAAQPASPFSSFGNNTPIEKPATPTFNFGQTQSQHGGSQAGSLPGSQTPSRAGSPSAFNFGNTQTPVAEAPAGSAFGFGQAPPASPQPSNFFGQMTTPSAPAPSNLFGQATPTATGQTTNLFGKPATQEAAQPLNPFAPKTGNLFANIKIPDGPTSPAPSSNFFGSQSSRSVSPEKTVDVNGTAPKATPSLFGAQTQQPAVANNLFQTQPSASAASPPKSIFSNLGNASPAKPLFGGSKEGLFTSQTPKSASATDLFGKPKISEAATPKATTDLFGKPKVSEAATPKGTTDLFGRPKVSEATTPKATTDLFGKPKVSEAATPKATTDLFGKPKVSEAATPKAAVSNIFGSSAQKPTESINIFAQPGQSFESNSEIEQTSTRGDSPLSEISNGAKSPSRNASLSNPKLGEINSSTRFNPPTPQPRTKSPSRTNQTSQLAPTSTAMVKLPEKSDMEITSLKQIVLERAAEYDETSLFSDAHKAEIARIIAKYFPPTISPRQQLEAYAAIQIKHLKRCAEQDMENANQPQKKMRIKEQLADWEQGVRKWSVIQAKKVEKRKADSLTDAGEVAEDGSNKRQKPSEQKGQKASISGSSPFTFTSEKTLPDVCSIPEAVSPPKNLFEPKTVETAPSPTPKGKRKADVQLTKDDPTGEELTPGKNGKGNGATSSATANLFRNIVGNTPTATPEKPVLPMKKATTEDKPRFNPFASLAIPKSPTKSAQNLASPLKTATTTANNATPTATTEPKAGGFVFKPSQSTSGPTDFFSQFAQAAKKTTDKEMQKAKDDDWDEDEETEAEWEARYHKEQAAKKELLKEKPTLAVPKFGAAQTPTSKEKANEREGYVFQLKIPTPPACPHCHQTMPLPPAGKLPQVVDKGVSGQIMLRPLPKLPEARAERPVQNLTGPSFTGYREAAKPQKRKSVLEEPAVVEVSTKPEPLAAKISPKETVEEDGLLPSPQSPPAPASTPQTKSAFAMYTNNNLSRVSANNRSGASSPGSVLDDYVPGSGKIGSKLANPFAHLSDAEAGSPPDAPSPAPMFGKHAVTAPPTSRATGFSFGAGGSPTNSATKSDAPAPVAPKSAPFSFLSNGGGLGPASSLGTSRATTPGVATDNDSGESAADSAAASHDGNDPSADLPQQKDLASGDEPGEETICLMKAKARKLLPGKKWGPSISGTIKLLRNEKTKALRYLLRLPNGSVALNKGLLDAPGKFSGKNIVLLLAADADRAEGEPPVDTWNFSFASSEEAKRFNDAIVAEVEKKL